jgi:hypothetical protein
MHSVAKPTLSRQMSQRRGSLTASQIAPPSGGLSSQSMQRRGSLSSAPSSGANNSSLQKKHSFQRMASFKLSNSDEALKGSVLPGQVQGQSVEMHDLNSSSGPNLQPLRLLNWMGFMSALPRDIPCADLCSAGAALCVGAMRKCNI